MEGERQGCGVIVKMVNEMRMAMVRVMEMGIWHRVVGENVMKRLALSPQRYGTPAEIAPRRVMLRWHGTTHGTKQMSY